MVPLGGSAPRQEKVIRSAKENISDMQKLIGSRYHSNVACSVAFRRVSASTGKGEREREGREHS